MLKILKFFRNNGPWIIGTLFVIEGIYALVNKNLPTWLFIGVILSTSFFTYNTIKFLYLKFNHN